MAFSRELLTTGGANAAGLSPKTVNSSLSVMKNIFEYAQRERTLQVADIRDISVKQPQKPMRILSRSEQQCLSQYLCFDPSPCHLGILLCLYTGLRIGEICALRWEDIFFVEQYLYVHQTMQRIQIPGSKEKKTKVVIQPPKSDCPIRKIPLPDEVLQLLKPAQRNGDAFLLRWMMQFLSNIGARVFRLRSVLLVGWKKLMPLPKTGRRQRTCLKNNSCIQQSDIL